MIDRRELLLIRSKDCGCRLAVCGISLDGQLVLKIWLKERVMTGIRDGKSLRERWSVEKELVGPTADPRLGCKHHARGSDMPLSKLDEHTRARLASSPGELKVTENAGIWRVA